MYTVQALHSILYCKGILCSGCKCIGFICIILPQLPTLLHINLHQIAAAKVRFELLDTLLQLNWLVSHCSQFHQPTCLLKVRRGTCLSQSHISFASKPLSGGVIRQWHCLGEMYFRMLYIFSTAHSIGAVKKTYFLKEIYWWYWNLNIIWTWPHFDAPKKVYLKRRGESASHYQIKRVME